MLKVVHVKPENYPHSACFDHVAAALGNAARHFPGYRGAVVIGAHLVKAIPSHAIIWNFEQVELGSEWMTDEYIETCRNAAQLWDYTPTNVAAWKQHYGIEAKLLPIAYDPAMVGTVQRCREPLARPRFYGSLNDWRNEALNTMPHLKLTTPIYGRELDAELSAAPCVLNLHYYRSAIFEIVRCSYLFANAVPVMSAESVDQDDYVHIPELFYDLDTMRQRAEDRDYPDGAEQRRAYMRAPHLREHLGPLLK